MTRKADFDAEEWTTLTAAPALAALAVAAADRGGRVREGLSMARTYQAARAADHSELMEALLTSPPGVAPTGDQEPAALADRAVEAVTAAATLLRGRVGDQELREYGDFVIAVTDAVARAHREGGVLGIGGKEVSALEHAVMERVAYALGERPPA